MGLAPRKKIVIQSHSVTAAAPVVQAIMRDVEAADFSENARFAIRLSLDEALSNAIRHGNRLDPNKTVTAEWSVSNDEAVISIADEGQGFHPEKVPDPTLDENLDRPNGRGVMLMKAYMTEVSFNERGNQVTLIKRKNCPLPTS